MTVITPRSRVLLDKLTGSHLVKKFSARLMEPDGSLPQSQVLATCPYPHPG